MDNLLWGLQTTVLGMGLVFALLTLLWGLLTLVLRLDPAPAAAPSVPDLDDAERVPVPTAVGASATVHGMDAQLVAAILVATLTHRAVRRREAAPAMRSYWPGSLLYASRWVGAGRTRQNQTWQRKGK